MEERTVPTCRVFFEELLKSNFFIKEREEIFLVTPTCARCNRLYGVGEVKGVEKRGKITKIKISDLTATLDIYTDKVLDLGKFMAFVGNLRMRVREGAEKIKGKGVLILVEEAGVVEESVRNNWIVSTARRTLERIELLRSKNPETECTWKEEALKHYAINDDKLDFWANMAINTVKEVWKNYSKASKERVLEVLVEAGKRGVVRTKLVKELRKKGLPEEWVEEVIDELIGEGRCYEPEVGLLKLVDV
jgi:RPA family protein